jgi:hypothetical protein
LVSIDGTMNSCLTPIQKQNQKVIVVIYWIGYYRRPNGENGGEPAKPRNVT